ncbi:hypothetical protein [Streptomyces litchfieldiae]|uniref:Secreted protein n=1 Tax=Streptomyces litchfieldiae TaxID=3075543 RepID=A0ABU2MMF5_9ACTN|nr:hypothetical protein [Streptomyces sp. DSM 44938]MDT0342715.1 hypothetical protein [Streptomyces sp. DSM 44938]
MTVLAVVGVLLLLGLVVTAGFLRGYLSHRPTAGVRHATEHAGFATPEHVMNDLSEAAVRRAGAQVRPALHAAEERNVP